jgi:alkylated DNA repair dioxygenase AlkB
VIVDLVGRQLSLLGVETPRFDAGFSGLRRLDLHSGAWVDYQPGWVRGHEPLFDAIAETADWHSGERVMYDRTVAVPRLTASFDPAVGPPLLCEIAAALTERYGAPLDRISMALYRDGSDSVAWHGDKELRDRPHALVAIVSLGEPRRFLMRPVGGGGSQQFTVGWGDLLVMGGTAQRTWEHCVPKVARAGPRMSVMFRHAPDR